MVGENILGHNFVALTWVPKGIHSRRMGGRPVAFYDLDQLRQNGRTTYLTVNPDLYRLGFFAGIFSGGNFSEGSWM